MAVRAGIVVKPKPGESQEALTRRFSKLVAEENIIQEIRRRERYEKPSQVRAQEEAKKRRLYERQRGGRRP